MSLLATHHPYRRNLVVSSTPSGSSSYMCITHMDLPGESSALHRSKVFYVPATESEHTVLLSVGPPLRLGKLVMAPVPPSMTLPKATAKSVCHASPMGPDSWSDRFRGA